MLSLPPDPAPGQPIRAADIAAIYRYLRQITPRSSGKCRVKTGSGGSTFEPIFPNIPNQAPVSGGSSTSTFPFQVTTRTNPANPSLYQASVYWNSSLLKNQVLNNTQTITGLADAPSPTSDGNPNWFNLDYGNDLIWLEIKFGSGAASGPTAAYINSYGMTSPPALNIWAPGDLPGEYGTGHGPFEYQITYDSSSNKSFTQYIARIAIFASITSGHSPFPVTNLQLLNSNLLLEGDVYGGALYTASDGPAFIGLTMPKPFAGPYISL